MESWQVIKAALDRTGVKRVASRMKLSQSLVYRWAQPPNVPAGPREALGSGIRNPLDRVISMLELTGEQELVHWICQRAGGFFVANPHPQPDADLAILRQTQGMIREFSDLLEAVSGGMRDDQRIDKAESARIREAWEKLKRMGETLSVCCERGLFGGAGGASARRAASSPKT